MARLPVHLNTDTGLLAFLRDDFPDFVRARGKDYYRRGKVRIERVRERHVQAPPISCRWPSSQDTTTW